MMNPQNGEIYALAIKPDFNLNEPFTLPVQKNVQETALQGMSEKEKQDALNRMWRNSCISDTYEPGSTFKTVTAAAGL